MSNKSVEVDESTSEGAEWWQVWPWYVLGFFALYLMIGGMTKGQYELDESRTETTAEVGQVAVFGQDLVVTSTGQAGGVVFTEVYSPSRLALDGIELVGDESLTRGVMIQTTTNCHPSGVFKPMQKLLVHIRDDCGATHFQLRLPTPLLEDYIGTQVQLAEVGS